MTSSYNAAAMRAKVETSQRKADIAIIHIAKAQLKLDEPTYRALLQGTTGLASAADMDMSQREAVIEALVKLGFKRTGGGAKRGAGQAAKPKKERPARLRLIVSLWLQLRDAGELRDASDKALNTYVKGQTGVQHVDWIDVTQQDQVIDSLRMWLARVKLALLNG